MFERFKKRSEFLEKTNFSSVSKDFAGAIRDKIKSDYKELAPYLSDALALDMTYYHFYHYRWRSHKLFSALLKDYLMEEYSLDKITAKSLIEFARELFSIEKASLEDLVEEKGKRFLEYLFVQIASAKSQDEILIDLVLSKSFLKRVKLISHAVFTAKSVKAREQLSFDTKIDESIKEVVTSLFEKRQLCPWILQFYRLYYQLDLQNVSEKECHKIYDFLVFLGTKKNGITEAKLRKRDGSRGDLSELGLQRVLDLLAGIGMVYSQGVRNKLFFASKKALEITSFSFAVKSHRKGVLTLNHLSSLPEAYQVALLEKWPKERCFELFDLLQKNEVSLGPRAFSLAIKTLSREYDHDDLLKFLDTKMKMVDATGYKVSLLGSYEFLQGSMDLKNSLGRLYKNEVSSRVRQSVLSIASRLSMQL